MNASDVKRSEPDDSIRVFTRENHIYGDPTAEQIEKYIAEFKSAKPPTGFKKLHEEIVSYRRPLTVVKVTTVYERVAGGALRRPPRYSRGSVEHPKIPRLVRRGSGRSATGPT